VPSVVPDLAVRHRRHDG